MKALDPSEFYKAADQLSAMPINTLFARSVINHQVSGYVYASEISPYAFYVAHPYGMSLLYGETCNDKFNDRLLDYLVNRNQKRVRHEWLQVYPAMWSEQLKQMLGTRLIKHEPWAIDDGTKVLQYTRVNFQFNINKYLERKDELKVPKGFDVSTEAGHIYEGMPGTVVPLFFWNNAAEFVSRGVAFSLIRAGEIAATAFSSYLIEPQLEIGIETVAKYRDQGLAASVCSLLIDYCLEHNFEPVWACRLDNVGSFRLAQRLGFEPSVTVPYYKLVSFAIAPE